MTPDEYRNILSHAIQGEIEACTYYRAIADKAQDKGLRDLFSDLAGDEEKHKLTLEGFLLKAPEELQFSQTHDYKVVDALPTPPLTPDLRPLDGLVIAIKKEFEAMQMYTQLADSSTDMEQKNIFVQLASMEREHKSRLEDIYTNRAFPEAW
jgi:rubrerythrin